MKIVIGSISVPIPYSLIPLFPYFPIPYRYHSITTFAASPRRMMSKAC